MTSSIRANSRRALENLRVAGASSIAELNALDPQNGDHRPIINGLHSSKFIVSDAATRLPNDPARYSLTEKGRRALDNKAPARNSRKPIKTYRSPTKGNVAGPVVYGCMSTPVLTNAAKDMLAPAARVGADDALAIPSRVNDHLHYRDGRVIHISHQPA